MKDYKKILEGVVNIISTTEKSDNGFANICTYIGENCPELAESEDERMVKFIKNQLFNIKKTITENYELDAKLTKAIDWLEKQGEKSNIHQDAEDDLRRQSTIRILEYARSLDAYNQYGKESINKDIAWLEKQSEISSIIYNSSNIGKNEHKCSWSEEDDKIRKALIELVKYEGGSLKFLDNPFDDVPMDTMLDWLEKQGENNMGISEATKKKLEDNLNKALEKETPESWNKFLEKQGEQKETLCDKCKKEQPSHSCQDITELGRCAIEHEQKPVDKVEPKFKVGQWVTIKE